MLGASAIRGQSRLVFAYLAWNRGTAIARSDLATLLWGEQVPEAWDTALSAILSRVRAALTNAGLNDLVMLSRDPLVTRLVLVPGAWVDIEAAATSLDAAEGAMRRGELASAWPNATVAMTILRRQLLPGDASEWTITRREEQTRQLIRALDCMSEIWREMGELGSAIEAAEGPIALDPLRERSYQLLIHAQTAAGNRAAAIRTYQQLKIRLADELGIDPAADTQELYISILS